MGGKAKFRSQQPLMTYGKLTLLVQRLHVLQLTSFPDTTDPGNLSRCYCLIVPKLDITAPPDATFH